MANQLKDYRLVILAKGQRLSSKLSKAQMDEMGIRQDANIKGNHIFIFRGGKKIADMGYEMRGNTLYLDMFSANSVESKAFRGQAGRSLAEEMVAHAVKKHSPKELLWESLSGEGGQAFIKRAVDRGDIGIIPGGKKALVAKWMEPALAEKVSLLARLKKIIPSRKKPGFFKMKRRL